MDFRNSPLLRRLIISSGFRVVGLIAATFFGLVLAPYMFAKIGDNDCGLMVFTGTVMGIIALLEAGLNAAVSRHVAAAIGAGDDDKLLKYFNSGFFLFLGVGLAAIGIATVLAFNLESIVAFSERIRHALYPDVEASTTWSDSETFLRNIRLTRIMLLILACQFAVELVLRALVGVVSGSLRTDIVSGAILVTKILRPCVSFSVLFLGGGVIALTTAGAMITILLVPFWLTVVGRLAPRVRISRKFVDFEAVRNLYQFGFFAFLSFLSRNFHTSIAILLLTSIYGLKTVAVYSMICYTLYTYGNDFVLMLTNFLAPIFAQLGARKERETMRKTLFFAIKVSTGAAAFVCFGLIVWGHPFIERWMCSGVEPALAATRLTAYPPLVLLALIVLFEQSQAPTVEFLYGTATHRYYALINMIEAGIAILLFPWLITRYGMIGVAAALLSASIVARLILQPYFVCIVLELPLRKYCAAFIMLIVKAATCLVLPGLVSYLLVDGSYPRLFLNGTICALVYGTMFFFVAFPKNERSLVLDALRKRST